MRNKYALVRKCGPVMLKKYALVRKCGPVLDVIYKPDFRAKRKRNRKVFKERNFLPCLDRVFVVQ